MEHTIKTFKKRFDEIKNMGWIISHRTHDTGIGKTFEDLMGIDENNSPLPDFNNILEIKTQRTESNSRITLFTKSPLPPQVNRRLYEFFGYEDENNIKNFHTTLIGDSFNSYKEKFGFKLEFNDDEKKIKLLVKNLKSDIINFTGAYYDYDTIKDKLNEKTSNIVFVFAESSGRGEDEKFRFTNGYICLDGMDFNKFIEYYHEGKISYDIRIGSYKSGNKKGQYHDHGSGFRIYEKDLYKFYNNIIKI
jgi:hypothetical protein